MSAEYVETHFMNSGESVWLAALGGVFLKVPIGARRGSVKLKPSVGNPFCVLSALAKAFHHTGNEHGAVRAEVDREESLLASDRLKFAATKASSYGCEARKIHTNALEVMADYPVLLQVSRTHVVAIWRSNTCVRAEDGLIFDSNEPVPLALTHENLSRCIGAPYSGDVVRGYEFVTVTPWAAVKRPADRATTGGSKRTCLDGTRICACCKLLLQTDAFSKTQRSHGTRARCRTCVE